MTERRAAEIRVVTYVFKRHVGEIYGGERSCAAVLSAMAELRRAVVVNCDNGFASLVRMAGIPVRVIPAGDPFTGFREARWRTRLRHAVDWFRHNAELFRALHGAQPDVVHANDVREVVMGGLALALLRRPVVTHVRCEMRMRAMHQAVLCLSASSVSVSQAICDTHIRRAHPALRKRIAQRSRVIHNGVDLAAVDRRLATVDRPALRKALGLAPGDVVALVVGSFEERKGQLELVRDVLPQALVALPALHVLMAGGTKGDGYRERTAQAVRRLPAPERVRILGFRADVPDLLAVTDMVLLPSKQEGLPRAILEAAASSVPAVAFGVSGTPETIIDGSSGFIVAPGDHDSFRARLVQLGRDGALRRRMGRSARTLAEQRFELNTTGRRTAAVIVAAADAARSRR